MSPLPAPIARKPFRSALLGAAALIAIGGAYSASNVVPFTPARAQAPVTTPALAAAMPSFADAIERVRGAVVSVKVNSTNVAAGGEDFREQFRRGFPGMPNDQLDRFFRQFRGEGLPGQGGGRSQRTQSQGSGFIISADGYVVTNNHVVRNGQEVSLVLDDGRTLAARVVGTDEKTDLALIKITEPGTYKFVEFASTTPRVGDWVLAIGNPFGLGGTVTAGIISARGRDIGAGPYDDFLQIDAPVNRGNSGGPTFDMNGNVVGVNTAIYSPSGGSVGIGFAIPASVATRVIDSLRENGTVSRGYLGVRIQAVTKEIADARRLPGLAGAMIAEAESGTPAANAGLRAGDVIVAVNGEKIADPRELSRKVASLGPSKKADITVNRDGSERTVSVTLGALPNERQASSRDFRPDRGERGDVRPDRERGDSSRSDRGDRGDFRPGPQRESRGGEQRFGMTLAPASDVAGGGTEGVVVAEIDPDGLAARQGVRSGDIILEAGGQKVANPDDVTRAIADARRAGKGAVMLRVKSGDSTRSVALTTRPS